MASFWSQPAWLTLHVFCLVQNVPQNDMESLFVSYSRSMPCPQCRLHMQQYLRKYPITKKTNLFEYSIDLHNQVNARQGKPQVSTQEAKSLIQSYINNFVAYKQKHSSIIETIAKNEDKLSLYSFFHDNASRSCIALALLCAVLICVLVFIVVRNRNYSRRLQGGSGGGNRISNMRFAF